MTTPGEIGASQSTPNPRPVGGNTPSAEVQLDRIREMLGIDQTVDVVEALGGYLRHLEARAWDIKADDRKVNVLVVSGVEGPSVYLDNYRIAGNKPWGGGDILYEFNADYEHVLRALGVQDSGRAGER